MICIKHVACPIDIRVSLESSSKASNKALEASTSQEEASVEVDTSRSVEVSDDCESWSDDSEETDSTSNDLKHVKVAVATVAARITFDFGAPGVEKVRKTSMENNARYFLKGYYWVSDMKSVPMLRVNDAVVFEDFFSVGFRMPPHLMLMDILCKFWVQLHELMPNAIVQIGKFIWAVSSCGGHSTTDTLA
jgi:hypothetical protein